MIPVFFYQMNKSCKMLKFSFVESQFSFVWKCSQNSWLPGGFITLQLLSHGSLNNICVMSCPKSFSVCTTDNKHSATPFCIFTLTSSTKFALMIPVHLTSRIMTSHQEGFGSSINGFYCDSAADFKVCTVFRRHERNTFERLTYKIAEEHVRKQVWRRLHTCLSMTKMKLADRKYL